MRRGRWKRRINPDVRPSRPDLAKAFDQGVAAGRKGWKSSRNPYDRVRLCRDAWESGRRSGGLVQAELPL